MNQKIKSVNKLLKKSTKFWLMHQVRSELKKLRKDLGLTQSDVAKKLGKDQVFVSNCESGRRKIDPVELIGFLTIYNSSISNLLDKLDLDKAQERDYVPT